MNKEIKEATCFIIDPNKCQTNQQISDIVWDELHAGVDIDSDHNAPLEFYCNDANNSKNPNAQIGFSIYPLLNGYWLHMNCPKNGELIVVLTHEHLEYEVDVMYDSIIYHVKSHFDIDLNDTSYISDVTVFEELRRKIKSFMLGPNIPIE